MKPFAFFIAFLISLCLCVACKKNVPNVVPEPPFVNTDSIANAKKWAAYQLPLSDTTLRMKWGQTDTFINGTDTLKITLFDIYDWVSEESSKSFFGATTTTYVHLQLNSGVIHKEKMFMDRMSEGNYLTLNTMPCKVNFDSLDRQDIFRLWNNNALFYHNLVINFGKLSPFVKTDAELKPFLKKDYTATFYLKKRCR